MWSKHQLEWTEDNKAYLSIVFTWQLPNAWSRCVWYRDQGYEVLAGGTAVDLMPDYLKDVSHNGIAINACIKAGIPKSKIRIYVLCGYNDTPADALYRMQTLKAMGLSKNSPMRYQPISGEKALVKDSYLSKNWTDYEMVRFVRYWFKQAWVSNIPYAEFRG